MKIHYGMRNIKTIVFVIILIFMGVIIVKSANNPNSTNNKDSEFALLDESLVKNLLIGKWRSTQDAKFSREFFLDGRVVDNYEGFEDSPIEGVWRYVDDTSSLGINLPDANSMPIVEIIYLGEYYYFGVIASVEAPDSLSLVYLDGNEILTFSRDIN